MEPVKIGAVMRAAAVGRVIKSKAEGFSEGDLVSHVIEWHLWPRRVIADFPRSTER